MDRSRRAVLAAVLSGGVGAALLSPAKGYLDRFAPLSGDYWDAATTTTPETVSSAYGSASVRYDDAHVPTIEGDSEAALAYAVGYVHGTDRRFQMDLFVRRMRGELAAAVGEQGVESDRFHRQMDFTAAAEANWDALEDTETGASLSAFADGVGDATADGSVAPEFQLLDYEPREWSPVDTLLIQKQIGWGLTGSFRTLRNAAAADALGADAAAELYPDRLDHDSPILRPSVSFDSLASDVTATPERTVDAEFARWASTFESPDGVGSNSWVVSGTHTESGKPLLANDPHLSLLAPPLWYRQHLRAPDLQVGGVAFPGVPFVVIGENDAGAWGFTNAGGDSIDFYRYDTDGETYRYGDETREFDVETQTIAVSGGEDREVTVRKSVHGPVLERFGQRVGVAWVGLQANRTAAAIRELNYSDGRDEAMAALRAFDHPTQNAVYADREGNTQYYMTGLVPRRVTDSESVPVNQIFDGSETEGEWPGYEPYGVPDRSEFVPSEAKPQSRDPDYLATANQRIVADEELDYYLAEAYSAPWRGKRIYDLLDERAASDDPMDFAFVRRVQRDVRDERAALFVPVILDVRGEMDGRARAAADELADWDYRMDRDSRAALVFAFFVDAYRSQVFDAAFEAAGLDDRFYPNDWVLLHLPPDSRWFEDPPSGDARSRAATIAAAMTDALDAVDEAGHEVYGDYNRTAIDHPFDQSFLNYPRYPTDGSPATVRNVRKASAVGSSYRLLARFDGETSESVIPGGNAGSPFSDHYDDQLRDWADGEYRPQTPTTDGDPDVEFVPEEGGDA
ncbi:penicillin acylase family protein [Halomicroarcula sp. F13]|uniref:Penicillin acylase family protein n=1 Tax=Haloarcula rubra TaxID=2487747 RepID=A0AAW4PKV4_9EURY|nr:penicillin acylase family protein [Halomicroarcula rubra]MBX0321707.1 penicillin acylase family protein [Halomicroarcula rubra]